jgi:hypothetical protein
MICSQSHDDLTAAQVTAKTSSTKIGSIGRVESITILDREVWYVHLHVHEHLSW